MGGERHLGSNAAEGVAAQASERKPEQGGDEIEEGRLNSREGRGTWGATRRRGSAHKPRAAACGRLLSISCAEEIYKTDKNT